MKKYIVGAMALISLSVAASAAVTPSAIPGITVTENTACEGGYIISSVRESLSKAACFNSCESSEIKVVNLENAVSCKEESSGSSEGSGSLGQTVNIDGVDVYFPAGYTTPGVNANDTCEGGFNNTTDDIPCDYVNLSALSDGYLNLTSVGGYLNLYENQLTNLDGLANLTSVGSHLSFYDNQLANVDGLANLTSVGGYLNISDNQLTNLDGLANLTSVGSHLSLYDNQLANVDGLANLTSVGGNLTIENNPNLTDLSGLNNLKSIGRSISLDVRDYAVKLDVNSYICQNFDTKVRDRWGRPYSNKADICNP